jgi:hypothetical protein
MTQRKLMTVTTPPSTDSDVKGFLNSKDRTAAQRQIGVTTISHKCLLSNELFESAAVSPNSDLRDAVRDS